MSLKAETLLGSETSKLPFPLRRVISVPQGREWSAILFRCAFLYFITALIAREDGMLGYAADPRQVAACDLAHWIRVTCDPYPLQDQPLIPLARDYASLYHIFMISYISVWAGPIIRMHSSVMRDLVMARAIARRQRASTRRLVDRANRRIRHPITHLIIVIAATASGVLGFAGYAREGIYAPLFSTPELSGLAYEGWWASSSTPSMLWFQVLALLGNYINWWATYLLIESMIVFRHAVRTAKWRLDALNGDGELGWSPIKALVRRGTQWTVVNMLGVLALAMLTQPSAWVYLAIFPVAFLASLLPYIMAKGAYELALKHGKANRHLPTAELRRAESLAYSIAPQSIISVKRLGVQFVFTVLPGVLAIIQEVRNAEPK